MGDRMNPCELTASVTALANAIACQLSDDDLGLAAAVFTQLGDTLATLAVQRARCHVREAPKEQQAAGANMASA